MKATFPYFESGLPLRSRDLNAIYARADEDVRNTRTCLQGMGIFYGLHARYEAAVTGTGAHPNQIVIQKGAGVTSQGYLFCAETDVVLSKISNKKFKIETARFSTDPFTKYLEEKETANNSAPTILVEELFVVKKDKDQKDEELKDVMDLTPDLMFDMVGTAPNTPKRVNKRLVVFFQVNKTKAEGCATCDKGILADLEIKYLLISEAQWAALTFACNIGETDPIQSFVPTQLSLSRVGFAAPCIFLNTWQPNSYDGRNNTAIEQISAEISRTVTQFEKVFSNTEGVSALAKLKSLGGANSTKGQYVHDYLRLIIRAYNEFVSAPFTRHFGALPPDTCFPKHLVLGSFNERETPSETERTKLYRPPFDDATESDFAFSKKLYERLMSLLNNHSFGSDLRTVLRITPSRRPSHPLSMQAIPFYLNAEEVRKTWRLTTRFESSIAHYGTPLSLNTQPTFDEADFYRIEGHIGTQLFRQGRNQIEIERDCQGLPFQVVVTQFKQADAANALTFSQFADKHNSLEHQGGVPAGGTFVVVVNEQGVVLADFCLPYWVVEKVTDVVASFVATRVPSTPNRYKFDALSSVNVATFNWFVDDSTVITGGEITGVNGGVFTRTFEPRNGENTSNFFVRLEAIANDGRKDVEVATVVVQRPVVLPAQIAANFTTTQNGNVFTFDATTSTPNDATLIWSVDNDNRPIDKAIEITGSRGEIFTRSFTEESKHFFVRLEVSKDGRKDVEVTTVFVQKTTQKATPNERPIPIISLSEKNESNARIIGDEIWISIGDNDDEPFIPQLILSKDGSKNFDKFRWELVNLINKDISTPTKIDESSVQPNLLWQKDDVPKKYRVRLYLWKTLFPEDEIFDEKIIVRSFGFAQFAIAPDPAEPVVIQPVGDKKEVPLVAKRGLGVAESTPSVVEPAAALKALRSRQKDYRTALEQAAAAESNDKTDAKIYAALTFISGFLPDASKTDEQMVRWQQVIEDALPSKKTGKISTSQQAIVQNLVCFLFDKLTDVQATGLSDGATKGIQSVFAKLKSYSTFDFNTVKETWQTAAIRTAENTATVDVLLTLFGNI
jgi:hypothetical protein